MILIDAFTMTYPRHHSPCLWPPPTPQPTPTTYLPPSQVDAKMLLSGRYTALVNRSTECCPLSMMMILIPSPYLHCVNLDALERKILRSLGEDFLHLNPCNNPALPTMALSTMPLNVNALPPLNTVPDCLDLPEAKICRSLHKDFHHLDNDPCAPDDDPPYPAPVSTLPPAIHTTCFPFGMAMHLLLAHQMHEDHSLPAPLPFIPASSTHYYVFPLALHLPTSLTLPCHSDHSPHNTMTHQSASLLPQYCP